MFQKFLPATAAAVAPLVFVIWGLAPADEAPARGRAGWLATFSTPDGKTSDHRSDRFVALYVPAGQAAMPRLPAGPFRAVWKGGLSLEFKGDYTFSAVGSGKLKLEANGAVVFEGDGDLGKAKTRPATLKRGANQIVVTYDSPKKGPASLRLLWQSNEFPPEPVPLALVRHEPGKELAKAELLRKGREAITNRRCLACHKADVAGWVKGGGMPELEMDAPSLADVGARLNAPWVARWLQGPQEQRPSANMPRPFRDLPAGEKSKLDPRVRDMAAYLATLGKPGPTVAAPKKAAVEGGMHLFARLGCVGCHLAPERDERKDDYGRLPLRDVSAKWQPEALVAFLRQPDKHYEWIRMPNFQLSGDEAGKLAAYLRSVKPREVFAPLVGADVAAGKKLVESAGCANCHALGKGKPPGAHPKAPAWAKLKAAECKGPDFGLAKAEAEAIHAVLSADATLPGRDTPAEFASRQLVSMRCNACHSRDGAEDYWSQLKDENEGIVADLAPEPEPKGMHFAAVQARPTLTWVGEKLKPEWTAALIAGKLGYKPRPFLKARMPAFPRRAGLLAAGLAAEHGCPPKSPPGPAVDEKLVEVGRLMASKGKWNCVGCHVVAKSAAVGVFEAPGVNFDMVKDRLRRDYYDRWMWAPTRVEPGTKMPTVYQWRKPSLLADVLKGDAHKQIDAIWAYLQQGKKIKPPPEE